MRVLILLAGAAAALVAQPRPESIRDLMEPGLERQRRSVRQQVKQAVEVKSEWFTVHWPDAEWSSRANNTQAAGVCFPQPMEAAQLADLVNETASREQIRPDLLREVVRRESGFDPCAVSAKGAMGLMQLMPGTAAALGVTDPFEPGQNLAAGAKYLGSLLERYAGDLRLALGAYNAGPSRVNGFGGVPPFEETQHYVNSILARLDPPQPPRNP
jgi:soluble lytic murein transglycosylase-like protein